MVFHPRTDKGELELQYHEPPAAEDPEASAARAYAEEYGCSEEEGARIAADERQVMAYRFKLNAEQKYDVVKDQPVLAAGLSDDEIDCAAEALRIRLMERRARR